MAYRRELTEYRKKYLRFRVAEMRREMKRRCIAYKGGQCARCGYDRCPTALTFHHRDPSQKEFGISANGNYQKFEKVQPELDKCDLLCQNCHAEVHHELDTAERERKRAELEAERPPRGVRPRPLMPSGKRAPRAVPEPTPCGFCGNLKPADLTFCSQKCSHSAHEVAAWGSVDLLAELKTRTFRSVAKELGCSDSAVHKRYKKLLKQLAPSQSTTST